MQETPLSPTQVVIALQASGKVIGSATNFMVNVDRRKLPVLALGRVDPLGFGRGFRIISGIIDYVVLEKDLLLEIMNGLKTFTTEDKPAVNGVKVNQTVVSSGEFELMDPIEDALYGTDYANISADTNNLKFDVGGTATYRTVYPTSLDMLPPIDIIVYGIDDAGKGTGMLIKGLEFSSSSIVATVNDVALAQRAEWVARQITPWMPASQS